MTVCLFCWFTPAREPGSRERKFVTLGKALQRFNAPSHKSEVPKLNDINRTWNALYIGLWSNEITALIDRPRDRADAQKPRAENAEAYLLNNFFFFAAAARECPPR
jgi:hypothetical protein